MTPDTNRSNALLDALRNAANDGQWPVLVSFLVNQGSEEFGRLTEKFLEYRLEVGRVGASEPTGAKISASNLSAMADAAAAYGAPNANTSGVPASGLTPTAQPPRSAPQLGRVGEASTAAFYDATTAKPSPKPLNPAGSKPAGHNIKRVKQEPAPPVPPPPPAPPAIVTAPNATVGRAYEFPLKDHLPDGKSCQVVLVEVGELATLGLEYDAQTQTVRGVPGRSGEFLLGIQDERKVRQAGQELPEKSIRLTINPDPKSLWKNIPSDQDAPYAKPDADKLLVPGDLVMVAASQRGRSHAQVGSHRDDDFRLEYVQESGWYLMAVADGAGSAKYSRKGARIACDEAIDYLTRAIVHEFDAAFDMKFHEGGPGELTEEMLKIMRDKAYRALGGAAHVASKAIKTEADTCDAAPKDYATTLLLAATKRMGSRWLVCAFWVGDGGMAIYGCPEGVMVLGEPDGGEFAGQTRFLTSGEVWQDASAIMARVRCVVVPTFEALVLMTDGVSDPKFETENNLKRKECWDELWGDLSASVDLSGDNRSCDVELLEWLNFWSPGNHDDRTIALLFGQEQ